MKKIALVAFIAISAHAVCQIDTIPLSYPFYYPEIIVPEPAYYAVPDNPIVNEIYCRPASLSNSIFNWYGLHGYTDVGIRHIADRPLTVIGLASSLVRWCPGLSDYQDWEYTNCKIAIGRTAGDSVSFFAAVPLYPSLENISKIMSMTGVASRPVWVFEGYFDTPIAINQGDTFYLSVQGLLPNSAGVGDGVPPDIMTGIAEAHSPSGYTETHWTTNTFRTKEYYTGEWTDLEMTAIPQIWLIIRRDEDTCPVPQPYAEKMSDNAVFVRWDNNTNHAAAEFSFGPAGIAPEDGTVYQSPIPQHVFGGLDHDSHYTVYARARCDFAQSEWTDWSAPLDIHLASMSGIDAAVPSSTLTLAPNPAADEARIACSHAMQSVTLFAADGTAMLSLHPDATEAAIDLRRLPRGTYTAVAETAAGTASRPLVVQ